MQDKTKTMDLQKDEEGRYLVKSGDMTVHVSFAGKVTLEDAVAHYLAMRENCREAMIGLECGDSDNDKDHH